MFQFRVHTSVRQLTFSCSKTSPTAEDAVSTACLFLTALLTTALMKNTTAAETLSKMLCTSYALFQYATWQGWENIHCLYMIILRSSDISRGWNTYHVPLKPSVLQNNHVSCSKNSSWTSTFDLKCWMWHDGHCLPNPKTNHSSSITCLSNEWEQLGSFLWWGDHLEIWLLR
jgi:hypothetical protein